MHFEILVEDRSGKLALDILVPKIIGPEHSFHVHSYKGLGRVPKNLTPGTDPRHRILLDQLPRLLSGYGAAFANDPPEYRRAVVVVCDLDDKCLRSFRKELIAVLSSCARQPRAHFCVAIEEGEAWLLGDQAALRAAYPKVKLQVLTTYTQDSICGTWEKLADAVYQGGARALIALGWQAVGQEKSRWAQTIGPMMDVSRNRSPSFQYLVTSLQMLSVGDS